MIIEIPNLNFDQRFSPSLHFNIDFFFFIFKLESKLTRLFAFIKINRSITDLEQHLLSYAFNKDNSTLVESVDNSPLPHLSLSKFNSRLFDVMHHYASINFR